MVQLSISDPTKLAQIHCVHKTFLLFQEAICYESLALSAHNYSRNKIPFLESAEDKFDAALESLPLPFSTTDPGVREIFKASPRFATFISDADSSSQNASTPTSAQTPELKVVSHTHSLSDSSSCYSSITEIDTDKVPDFNKYSFHRDLAPVSKGIPRTSTFKDSVADMEAWPPAVEEEEESIDTTDEDDDIDVDLQHKEHELVSRKHEVAARLQGSLSSTRTLESALVPSPLFNKSRKTAVVHSNFTRTVSGQLPVSTLRPLPLSTPGPLRPVPPTPHSYNTHDHLALRRTAISTLISKFESTLPSPTTPTSYTTCKPPSTACTAHFPSTTPVTPRFTLISDTFQPHPHNTNLASYLTSHSLARYNNHLSDFRQSLLSSIDFISTKLDTIRSIQTKRKNEKATHFTQPRTNATTLKQGLGTRLASYWLLSPSPAPHTTQSEHTHHPRRSNCDISPTPMYSRTNMTTNSHSPRALPLRTCDASGSDFTTTSSSASSSSPSLNNRTNDGFRTNRLGHLIAPESAHKRQERLAKLRADGWRVKKEGYGFKGCEYYDKLRAGVERELGLT